MRITNQMSYQQLSSSVLDNQQAVYNAQQQVSSGKRISVPSDDPVDFGRMARMNNMLGSVQRYSKNIDQAKSELATVDSTLQQAGNIFQRANELAVQAADGTKSAAERKSMGEEVDALLTSLLTIANTTYDGHTLFSGTSGAQKAYAAQDSNGDGRLDTFTYQGGADPRVLAVTDTTDVAVGIPGSDTSSTGAVFQTSSVDLFATLQQFRDQLLSGATVTGSTIGQQLQESQEHLTSVLATVGGRSSALDASSKLLSQRETDLTDDVGNVQSLDLAKAMMTLTNKQQAYQAALSATAGLSKNTLIDWLR